MISNNIEPSFRVWGADNVIHGPVNLVGLIEWVRNNHVTRATWIFTEPEARWIRAADMPQLNMFFGATHKSRPELVSRAREMGVTSEVLRRIKILSQMDDDQLEQFIGFIEVVSAESPDLIVRRGAHGDAMYLVLEGEVRARIEVGGKERILNTLSSGDFFGEISLLDQGPRSADVVANEQTVLLKITAAAFETMKKQAPDVALAFLDSVSRSVVTRMRILTQRYKDTVQLSDAFGGD